MDDKNFAELLQGAKEALAYLKGEGPARVVTLEVKDGGGEHAARKRESKPAKTAGS